MSRSAKGHLQVEGRITYPIKRKRIVVKSAGVFNPLGGTGRVDMQHPAGLMPDRHGQVANSCLCVGCVLICLPADGRALNLLEVTSGNYTLTRTYTYPDARNVGLTGKMTFDGDTLRYEAEFSGDLGPDPKDLTEVTRWQDDLVPAGRGRIRETGFAVISSGKQSFKLEWTGMYKFKGNLARPQRAKITWKRADKKLARGR
jgi:hypothetical protein